MLDRRDDLSVRTEELRHENEDLEATVALLEGRRRVLASERDELRIRLELVTLTTRAVQAGLRGRPVNSGLDYCVRHGRRR